MMNAFYFVFKNSFHFLRYLKFYSEILVMWKNDLISSKFMTSETRKKNKCKTPIT